MLKYSDISWIFHISEGDLCETEPVADINHFITGRFCAFFAGEKSCFGFSGVEKVGGVTGSVPLLCSRTRSVLQEAQLAAISQCVHAEVRNVLLPVSSRLGLISSSADGGMSTTRTL